MVERFPRTLDRSSAAWVLTAGAAGALGCLLLVAAVFRGCDCRIVLALLGAVHLAASAYALRQHAVASFGRRMDRAAREATRRAEIITLLAVLPSCLLLAWLGLVDPKPQTHVVVGRPVEMRSQTALVVMPGGQAYRYVCWKDEGRGSGTCPAEARWKALPRWPEPRQVRMEVLGDRIRGLAMDGVVIVDPEEFKSADVYHRALALVFGGAGAVLAMRGIWRRRPRSRTRKAQ